MCSTLMHINEDHDFFPVGNPHASLTSDTTQISLKSACLRLKSAYLL